MKGKNIIMSLIILGVLGAITFFPINISDHYTCLFHLIIDGNLTSTEIGLHQIDENMHHSILDIYLKGYAYFWWTSILILVIGIYLYRNKKSLINY
jgi:hypothetical protein